MPGRHFNSNVFLPADNGSERLRLRKFREHFSPSRQRLFLNLLVQLMTAAFDICCRPITSRCMDQLR